MDTIPADFETLVFEKSRLNKEKLLVFGFSETENGWKKDIPFHNGEFRADIRVDKTGAVTGHVIETEMEEEYLPLRVASQTSAFVSGIRAEYCDLLMDIRTHAFDDQLFRSAQANRLAAMIEETFHDSFDHPFQKDRDSVVFRVPGNQKWYALVMHVERAKVQGDDSEGTVDIINLKAEEKEQEKLICEVGIYPAWHMNKKKWISVVLDDSLKDQRVMSLIQISRMLTDKNAVAKTSNEYIVPSNPKYYDIKSNFRIGKTSLWHQSIKAKAGDIVYVYSGAPDSAILFKTVVEEADIPSPYYPDFSKVKKAMRLRIVKRYPPELITMKVLRAYGVTSMHGAKKVPVKLKKVIDSLADID